MSEAQEAVTEESVRLEFKKIDDYENTVSASGNRTKSNGDEISHAVQGLNAEELTQLAGRLKIEVPDYSHLNAGMQVMNIRNKIRKAVNAAEKAEEGSGLALLAEKVRTIKAKADKRIEKLQAEKADRKAAREAKAAEKAKKKDKPGKQGIDGRG